MTCKWHLLSIHKNIQLFTCKEKEFFNAYSSATAQLRSFMVRRFHLSCRRLDVDDRIAYLCIYPDSFGSGDQSHVYRGDTATNCAWLRRRCIRGPVGSQACHDHHECVACTVPVAIALFPLGEPVVGRLYRCLP